MITCRGHKSKYTIEYIFEEFKKEGYTLLSTQYISNADLYYLCPKGHQGSVYWQNWRRKKVRCSQCAHERNASGRRHTIEHIGLSFAKEGYLLLSTKYKNNSQKLDYQCPIGHKHSITFSDWITGHRCAECAGNKKKETFEISSLLKQQGYILLSEYEKSSDKIQIQCPHGDAYWVKWNNFQQGNRCPLCCSVQSKGEKEVSEIYKTLSPLERNRTIIGPKELDLYFPTQKVAIEYCGLYWHSEYAPGERMVPGYHRIKLDLCTKQNIRLLTIFEDEWLNHKDICISRINSALGIVQNKIFARKCLVKQIPNKEAREFLARTHLQGAGSCKIAYGLFYNNKLVQVMTFGSPNRAHTSKGKRVLELKRLSGELNTIITGGASKLFKLGLQYAKDNNYEIVKSYCDLRWGTGNLYAKLGFTKVSDGRPSCHYTDGINRYRNQTLAQIKGVREIERAQKHGLYKIYDCGHQTWKYEVI